MVFPFIHRNPHNKSTRTPKDNPTVSTAFVAIPSSIVLKLSHFPLTTNALDYTPFGYSFMLGGEDNARSMDAVAEQNGVYGVVG